MRRWDQDDERPILGADSSGNGVILFAGCRVLGWMECAPGFGFLGGGEGEQTLQHNVSHRAENRHPCLFSLLPPIPDPMIRIAPAAIRSAVMRAWVLSNETTAQR